MTGRTVRRVEEAPTLRCRTGTHTLCATVRTVYSTQHRRRIPILCGCPCHREEDT